jgi:hypothetical protein
VINTYAAVEGEYRGLCEALGSRLEEEAEATSDPHGAGVAAVICYLCAGNIEDAVRAMVSLEPAPDSAGALQRTAEKTIVLRMALVRCTGLLDQMGCARERRTSRT